MPDVAKLREEAEAKGLHGDAEKRYVGGVFNRIRQAHARATTPGKGAAHLNRAARKEARKASPYGDYYSVEPAPRDSWEHAPVVKNKYPGLKPYRVFTGAGYLGTYWAKNKAGAERQRRKEDEDAKRIENNRESIEAKQRRAREELYAQHEEDARRQYANGESQAQKRLRYLEDTVIPIGERSAREGSALAKRNLPRDKAEASKLRKRIAQRKKELGLE